MRTLIVDPEPSGRAVLRRLCEDDASIGEVTVAENGATAIEMIRINRPDLLFLDVDLKDMTGFELLRSIKGTAQPAVIMVAAHEAHAIEAFRGGAIDYLTKPVGARHLACAIEKVQRQCDSLLQRASGKVALISRDSSQHPQPRARLMAEHGHRLYFLAVEEIDYIDSCGNYVLIHVGDQTYVRRDTLSRLAAALREAEFVWIQRSILINLSRVAFAEKLPRGALGFTLKSGTQLVSRAKINIEEMRAGRGGVEP